MVLPYVNPSSLNSTVSEAEFKSFHTIDRTLYTRLVLNLSRDPAESMQVVALFLWLEQVRYARHMVDKTLALPDTLINSVADEAVLCLNCIESDHFDFPPITEDILPLLSQITNGITLQYFHQNRISILRSVTKIVNDVCVRAFDDISRMVANVPNPLLGPFPGTGQSNSVVLRGDGSSSSRNTTPVNFATTINPSNVNQGMNVNVVGGIQNQRPQLMQVQSQQINYNLSGFGPVMNPPMLPPFNYNDFGQTRPNVANANTAIVQQNSGSNLNDPSYTIKSNINASNANANVTNNLSAGGNPSFVWGSLGPYGMAGQRQILNYDNVNIGEVMSKLNINATSEGEQEVVVTVGRNEKDVPVDDRTIFLTFSKGYPITEEEVRDFFTQKYGNCIEAIYMQEVVEEEQQPLYARLVVYNTETLDAVVQGKAKAKFAINGKHVWARKYVRNKKPLSPPLSAVGSPSRPPPPPPPPAAPQPQPLA